MTRAVVAVGDKFGSLEVVTIVGRVWWRSQLSCRCSCGRTLERNLNSLRSSLAQGKTPSCPACVSAKRSASARALVRAGRQRSGLYLARDRLLFGCWLSFRKRRKPAVDPRWSSYEPFRAWAKARGWRKGAGLRKIERALPYGPDNCIVRLP